MKLSDTWIHEYNNVKDRNLNFRAFMNNDTWNYLYLKLLVLFPWLPTLNSTIFELKIKLLDDSLIRNNLV